MNRWLLGVSVVMGCSWAGATAGPAHITSPAGDSAERTSVPRSNSTAQVVAVAQPVLVDGVFLVLEPGLELARFRSTVEHPVGDGSVHVLRVDPDRFDVVAHMASEEQTGWHSAEGWASRHDLVAVINSSMFHPSGRSVFRLVTAAHSNSPAWKSGANNVLLSGSLGDIMPRARVLDATCESRERIGPSYSIEVQSWRLLDCAGRPTWKVNRKIWSHALIGQDDRGRIVFVHARTPYNTRVFTDILLSLPLGLKRLQYAEGGPEATLFVQAGGQRFLQVGSYETDFTEHDNNRAQWNLPNVVGVRRRPKGTGKAP